MKSYVLALAAMAANGLSGAAYAGDAKPAVKNPVALSDAELDRVTAGVLSDPGYGRRTVILDILGHSPGNSLAAFERQGFKELPTGGLASVGRCPANLATANCPASDIRLKRDIVQIARLHNGLVLYRYRYNWSDQVYVGVMAQEVALVRPDAVIRGADGYLRVDYSRLGLHLMTWQEWMASRLKTAENATTITEPAAMSDAEMDEMTAGTTGQGVATANEATGGRLVLGDGVINAINHGGLGQKGHIPGSANGPGVGRCTAGFAGSGC